MGILDKASFSANDFIKGIILLTSIGSMWYNLKLDNKDLKNEIAALKTYETTDHILINSKIDRLESAAEASDNRTNELEKNVIKLMAIVPSFKLQIEEEL
jgi:hypothetical protein